VAKSHESRACARLFCVETALDTMTWQVAMILGPKSNCGLNLPVIKMLSRIVVARPEEATLTRGVSNMFARVALLSAIGMVLALAVAPVPVRAAGHGHQNEVNFQAYTAECAKMDPKSQAYKDCMNLAEGQ